MRPAVRLASLQWLAAWAVVLQAALARYAPSLGPLGDALVLAACGAVFRTSPVALGVRRRWEAAIGAASLVVLGLALRALAPAASEGPPPFFAPPWVALAVLLLADRTVWPRLARLVGVEWLKMRRSRLFQAGLVAVALVTLLAAFTHDTLPQETGWTLAGASLGAGQIAAEVFLLVLGATALAGEATGGTMKMLLPHAYRRSDWIVAKTLVLLLVAVCFAVVVAVVAVGHAAWKEGLGDVMREPMFGEAPEAFQTADVMSRHLTDTCLSGLAALAATALLGLFVSALFDGVVAALCVAFLLFAGLEFTNVVLSLPRETLQGIYAWYPAEIRTLTGKLGRVLNERWDQALLPEGLRLALLTGFAALLLGVGAFSHRDIQA